MHLWSVIRYGKINRELTETFNNILVDNLIALWELSYSVPVGLCKLIGTLPLLPHTHARLVFVFYSTHTPPDTDAGLPVSEWFCGHTHIVMKTMLRRTDKRRISDDSHPATRNHGSRVHGCVVIQPQGLTRLPSLCVCPSFLPFSAPPLSHTTTQLRHMCTE